ncbi:hypothetical protein GGR01_002884 [Acetobacter oeni]|nr:hypothetical protein [Acetobacter oeni]
MPLITEARSQTERHNLTLKHNNRHPNATDQ